MTLPEKVERAIRTRKLLRDGQEMLVAVSGGVDSMVMLHLLHTLSRGFDWRLKVAHFNHRLRGRSSDADERLVRSTARELGLPLIVGSADVRRYARLGKISIEMAARQLRHDFLARAAYQRGIPTIALAHHVDDQLELFFLRLFRGSGGTGLGGMSWRNPSPANPKIELVRPLLEQTKEALIGYAAEAKIRFREDKSNRSTDIQRNRVRHRLLPLLRKEFQPVLDQVIWRTMEIVGAESDLVESVAARWLKAKRRQRFTRLSVAVQRRALQQQLLAQGIAPSFDLIEKLREHATIPVTVEPGLVVTRNAAGELILTRRLASKVGPEEAQGKRVCCRIGVNRSGEVLFAGSHLIWKVERPGRFRRPNAIAGREVFDADSVGSAVILRHWRAGDRFQPIGMQSAVKLQDLFVNAKIPRANRDRLIVATTASGEIFWVEKLRIGELFKMTPQTRRCLCWKWTKTS